jgi:hypothetical protein
MSIFRRIRRITGFYAALCFAAGCLCSTGWAAHVEIYVDENVSPAAFGANEIEAALRTRGDSAERRTLTRMRDAHRNARIIIGVAKDPEIIAALRTAEAAALPALKSEGFSIQRTRARNLDTIWILGADAGGAMYGALEVAEQIRVSGFVGAAPLSRSPYMAMRGTKFNIPLDVRTPSYSDMSDAAQANIGDMWDFEFWREYLDTLARHRYNYVSLWNLHPFPSLVKVPEYPDVALADVKRSTIEFDEDYPTIATELVTREMLARTETLAHMSIEDKIAFWRRVMQYGKDRNIDFYIVTWNIYTYGVDGKYGITDAIDNPTTIDYFRKSVRELLRTYPLLRGVGLTTGENMPDEEFQTKENWAFATYGQGVLDVAREQPDRPIRFIHRQHQTRAQDIAKTFAPLVNQRNVDFIFSFKYAQAHALSSTKQTFHDGYVESLGDLKTIWTLRNDDALMFRWGAPDFVREFIRNIPHDPSQGYYLGSDMWVWGRDFLSRSPAQPRRLEIDKHWYHWMLWGRLGFDPSLDNERIIALIEHRFAGVPGRILFDAWQHASMIYPLTTGFHWANFDFQWYIEGCRSRPGPAQTASGFHDVNRFITLGTHPGTDNIAIPRYVEAVVEHEKLPGTSPLQVAQRLDSHADAALAGIAKLVDAAGERASAPSELHETLGDIRAMALLGKYYAAKIRGATALALFRRTEDTAHQNTSVRELTEAVRHWDRYTAQARSMYKNPLWTNRVGYVDWDELTREVATDIEIAKKRLGVAEPGERRAADGER